MKCTGCGFESNDDFMFTLHLIECKGKPSNRWESYSEYGAEINPTKPSDLLKEE